MRNLKSQFTELGLLGLLLVTSLSIIGCAAFKTGAPPTAVESKLFDVHTNFIPIVLPVTNYVQVTSFQTNVVPVFQTNAQQVAVVTYQTNVVPVTVQTTNVSMVATQQANYTYTIGKGGQDVTQVGGLVGNLFGVGGLVSTGLAGLLSIWGWVRSSKNYATGANLAQSIETIRSFVQQLPNGAVYDKALTDWLQNHQVQTGEINQVLTLLANEVNNDSAKMAAQQIMAAIAALNPSAVPKP